MDLLEFERLTGIYPGPDVWEVIQKEYKIFPGGEKAFCRAYKKNCGHLAEDIQVRASLVNGLRKEEHKKCETALAVMESQLKECQCRLEEAQAQLERKRAAGRRTKMMDRTGATTKLIYDPHQKRVRIGED